MINLREKVIKCGSKSSLCLDYGGSWDPSPAIVPA